MTAFALDLDHDGIRLLERTDQGWSEVGTVALDDPDLPARMRELATEASARTGGEFDTELIIPPSQILYKTLAVREPNDDRVRAALDGLTPCPIDELVFDWRIVRGGIRVAAVDRTTLDEAEGFATTYAFNPTRFTARPGPEDFPDDPDFGATEAARLGYGETEQPVFVSGRAEVVDADSDAEPSAGNIFAEDPEPDASAEAEDAGANIAAASGDCPAPEPDEATGGQGTPDEADTIANPGATEGDDAILPDARTEDAPAAAEAQDKPAEAPLRPETPETAPAAAALATTPGPVGPAVAPPARRRPAPGADAAARQQTSPLRSPQRTAAPHARPAGEWRRTAIVGVGTLAILAGLIWIALALVTPDFEREPIAAEPERIASKIDLPTLPRPGPGPSLGRAIERPALPSWNTASLSLSSTGLPAPETMAARRLPEGAEAGARSPEREVLPPGQIRAADVWQSPPPPGPDPVAETIDDLYLASLDPVVDVGDAFALAPVSREADPIPQIRPAHDPSRVFDLDERGFVRATPDGAETPDGVIVTLGEPPLRPPERPVTAIFVPDPEAALALAGKRPRNRPADLMDRVERDRFGGRTLAELRTIRARPRPESDQEIAAADTDPEAEPSALAVEVSRAPIARPEGFATVVAAILANRAEQEPEETVQVSAAAPATAPRQPRIPTSASVARQATIENAINLKRVNLIGVYGTAANRRALVRLPSGRYRKVQIGDRIDGGRINAIGDNELQYQKGGRNVVLRVPAG